MEQSCHIPLRFNNIGDCNPGLIGDDSIKGLSHTAGGREYDTGIAYVIIKYYSQA